MMKKKQMTVEGANRVWKITLEDDDSGKWAFEYMDFEMKNGRMIYQLGEGVYTIGMHHDSKARYFIIVYRAKCDLDGTRLNVTHWEHYNIAIQNHLEKEQMRNGWYPCRKKPVVVHVREVQPVETGLETLEGYKDVDPETHYIIKGTEDELYPIRKDIFRKNYIVLPDQEA